MKYVFIAQLNQDNVVVSVSQLKLGIQLTDDMVTIPTFEESLLGGTYDPESGAFITQGGDTE